VRLRALAAVVLTAAVAMGAAVPAAARDTSPKVDVVASFYPLAWAAAQVGGGHVRVTNLTPAGAEPHDLELTPDQRDAIEDAVLAIVMGKGFQPAVEDAADDRDGPTLRVLSALGLSGRDPHVWLDPVRMREIVDAVAAALAKADPEHAADFRTNAAMVDTKLRALDDDYRTGLATCERDLLLTAHEAFGHLAKRYGLRQEGVVGISPDAEPSPDRLGELADLAEREGVTTIFTEELVSPKVARTLAREAGGLRTAVLHPLEALTDDEAKAGADYLSEMRDNLRTLQRALGCT
jgi:zinc transport system substrate-binding protein